MSGKTSILVRFIVVALACSWFSSSELLGQYVRSPLDPRPGHVHLDIAPSDAGKPIGGVPEAFREVVRNAQKFEGLRVVEREPLRIEATGKLEAVNFSADGSRLLVYRGSKFFEEKKTDRLGHQVSIIMVPTGEVIWEKLIFTPFMLKKNLCMSPDGKLLLVTRRLHVSTTKVRLELYDIETDRLLLSHTPELSSVGELAFSGDSRWFHYVNGENHICTYPVDGGDGWRHPFDAGKRAFTTNLVPSENGRVVVAAPYTSFKQLIVTMPPEDRPDDQTIGDLYETIRKWQYQPGRNVGDHYFLPGRGDLTNLWVQPKSNPTGFQMHSRSFLSLVDRPDASSVPHSGLCFMMVGTYGRLEVQATGAAVARVNLPLLSPEELLKRRYDRHEIAMSKNGRFLVPRPMLSPRETTREPKTLSLRLLEFERIPFAGLTQFVEAVRDAARQNQFDELDQLYGVLTANDVRTPPHSLLPDLRSVLVEALWNVRGNQLFERWLKNNPESIPARVSYARHLKLVAWARRGSGFAGSVSEEDWSFYKETMGQVSKLLLSVPIKKAPVQYYRVAAEVARDLDWEPALVDAMIDNLLDSAYQADEDFHHTMAFSKFPRWGGEPGEAKAYLQRVRDHIGGEQGLRTYIIGTGLLFRYLKDATFYEQTGFSGEEMIKQIDKLEKLTSPEDALVVAGRFRFAAVMADEDLMLKHFETFEQGGKPCDLRLWHTYTIYNNSVRAAERARSTRRKAQRTEPK